MRLTIEREPSIDPQFLDSSIMALPESAQFVFIWMILLANKDGILDMGPTALARRLCRPVETIKAALKLLESEDPESRSPDAEGARIKRERANDSAWQIVNYGKYTHLTIRCEPAVQSIVLDATGGVLDLESFNRDLIANSIVQSDQNGTISSPHPSSQHTKYSNTGKKELKGSGKRLSQSANQQPIFMASDGQSPVNGGSNPIECAEWIPINGVVPHSLNRGPVRNVEGRWEFGVTIEVVKNLQHVFPGLDVPYQLRLCRLWNMENPGRRKTYPNRGGGVLKHITSWMTKAYEKAASRPFVANQSTAVRVARSGGKVIEQHELTRDRLRDLVHKLRMNGREKSVYFSEIVNSPADKLPEVEAKLKRLIDEQSARQAPLLSEELK